MNAKLSPLWSNSYKISTAKLSDVNESRSIQPVKIDQTLQFQQWNRSVFASQVDITIEMFFAREHSMPRPKEISPNPTDWRLCCTLELSNSVTSLIVILCTNQTTLKRNKINCKNSKTYLGSCTWIVFQILETYSACIFYVLCCALSLRKLYLWRQTVYCLLQRIRSHDWRKQQKTLQGGKIA